MIDLFIFDEGGVMIRDFNVMPAMAARLGVTVKEMNDLIRPDMHDLSAGKISGPEFWARVSARTGREVKEDLFRTLFDPKPIPESFALVRELAAKVRTVGGTNTIDSHHEIIAARGLYEGFHTVYASNIIGFVKPDPAFWQAILDAEGVKAERAFFTDDLEANVEAARRLGMQAHLFTDAAALRARLAELGVLPRA